MGLSLHSLLHRAFGLEERSRIVEVLEIVILRNSLLITSFTFPQSSSFSVCAVQSLSLDYFEEIFVDAILTVVDGGTQFPGNGAVRQETVELLHT